MKEIELIMPKMGESIAEATILKWLKKEGEPIEADEAVLEIATDKVDSEVPAPTGGVMGRILFQEGEVVAVGKAIATINVGGGAGESPQPDNYHAPQAQQPVPQQAEEVPYQPSEPHQSVAAEHQGAKGDRFYSPLVMNIARQEGISMAELNQMNGTGQEGRVTKRDIQGYLQSRKNGQAAEPQSAQPPQEQVQQSPPQQAQPQQMPAQQPTAQPRPQAQPAVQQSAGAGDEIIEMDRMRKLIADHMVMSVQTSPHVTSFVEADVTGMVKWRERVKKDFEKREGEKITYTPIFIEAITRAIKDFPMINASVNGSTIIKKRNINIGMAAALPSGNLIVPVIKNADQKNLIGLTREVNDFARRARSNSLKPDEIQGGTFTLTNVGTFGNVMGTPIINQPQVAIMAAGAIKKKPVVLETPDGDVIAIRHMMFLSLSYDHRVVDGMLGGSFLRRVADYLEGFDAERQF